MNHEKVVFYLKAILFWTVVSIGVGILFYDSYIVCAVVMCGLPVYIKLCNKKAQQKAKADLLSEFADALQSLSAALEAGYSMENALAETLKDLRLLYADSSTIIKEFTYMLRSIANNETVENAINAFAASSGLEDAVSFAEVFSSAKRTGGDLIKIIKTTCDVISQKAQTSKEIDTMISGKRYEALIMQMVPFGILVYFRICSPGYLDALYGNVMGCAVMSACLGVYLFAGKMLAKVTNIEI
jgi:tight adherence protein B